MTDRYTKTVLTIIAAALVGLVVQNAIGPLAAESGISKVAICDPTDPAYCARIWRLPGNDNFALQTKDN
jgi:hypothetical protein